MFMPVGHNHTWKAAVKSWQCKCAAAMSAALETHSKLLFAYTTDDGVDVQAQECATIYGNHRYCWIPVLERHDAMLL